MSSASFERQAGEQRVSALRQLWEFLGETKKWWLTPIVIALLAIGLLVQLGGTAAAPFIYTIF